MRLTLPGLARLARLLLKFLALRPDDSSGPTLSSAGRNRRAGAQPPLPGAPAPTFVSGDERVPTLVKRVTEYQSFDAGPLAARRALYCIRANVCAHT